MDTSSYSTLLWRRKWLIAGTFLITMLVVALGTLILTPTYEATATLRVRTAARGSLDWVDYDIAYTERLMNTYARLATSDPVLQEVAQRLGSRGFPSIRAEVVPDTELMTITAVGEDPALVAEAANTLTAIVVNQGEALYAETTQSAGDLLTEDLAQAEAALAEAQAAYAAAAADAPADTARLAALSRAVDVRQEAYASLLSQYDRARIAEQMRASALSIVELATVPNSPAAPDLPMNLVLGGLLGLAGGLVLAVVFQKLDRRLYTEREVEEVTGLPVLTTIGDTPQWRSLVFGSQAGSTPELYHRLRASVDSAREVLGLGLEDGGYTLLMTSTQPGEGKSMVATNLAIAMGQAGRRVVIVEGNLHRPAVHTNLSLHNEAGLTTVLEGKWTLNEALQMTRYAGVWALTSGPLRSTPVGMLSSPQMGEMIESLEGQFDVVLLDGPSLLGTADASVLETMADGVVLVVSVADANRDALQAASTELSRTGATLLGVVANRVPRTGDERFKRYYDRSPAARLGEAVVRGGSTALGSGVRVGRAVGAPGSIKTDGRIRIPAPVQDGGPGAQPNPGKTETQGRRVENQQPERYSG
ncbi:MAG TPA: polysaccharide biosynthesis tyrosine autokinase [Anaerolineae bacterium]|nr:polysaccharide biosynthesis tyrosine autokinase [Anaerolineae bacterium]